MSKYSYEEVKNYIEVESNSGCELLSKSYNGTKEKLSIKCKCNEIFSRDFNGFKNAKQYYCNTCANKERGRKTDHKYFADKVAKLTEDYLVLGTYTNNKAHIEFVHKKCNQNFTSRPDSFIYKLKNDKIPCVACRPKRYRSIAINYTTEDFKNEIHELTGDDYTLLGEYEFAKGKILIKHNTCKNEYYCSKNDFIYKNSRCPYCSKNKKMNTSIFKSRVFDLVGDEYIVLNEYINSANTVKIQHKTCGYISEVYPSNFLSHGKRCNKCSGHLQVTQKEFDEQIKNLTKDEYLFIESYNGVDQKISATHKNCGYTFKIAPYSFIHNGSRCPKCSGNLSYGAKEVMNFLDKNNVTYEIEKTFDKCKDKKYLPFDFYLNDFNILVEFDGGQHFEPVSHWGGEEGYADNTKKDQIKNQYCINNDILLIRIPYWEFDNIEHILNNSLGYFDVIANESIDEKLVHKFLVNHSSWSHEKYIEQQNTYSNKTVIL